MDLKRRGTPILTTLKKELLSYDFREKMFIFFAMCCNFLICAEYAVVRPVCNSIFIHLFSAKFFPYAWICVIPFNFLLVSLYNRLLIRWGSKKLFTLYALIVLGSHLIFAIFSDSKPVVFSFYVWKEIYILLLFQFIWPVIHSNIEVKRAKYLYGFFFGIGGLGAMFGSMLPSFLALSYGSEKIILFTFLIYALLIYCFFKMGSYSKLNSPEPIETGAKGFVHGIKLIGSSRFLMLALLTVVFMQMSTAFVDFEFNHFLERVFPLKDQRTAHSARIFTLMHAITVFLQFIGVYFLIRWVGLKKLHLCLPAAIGVSMALFVFFPIFPLICTAFITTKAIDFSLFGVIKEMLYIPLKSDEKFRAKSVIDIFAYRGSKAFASILILSLQFFFTDVSESIGLILIGFCLLWMGSIFLGLRGQEHLFKEQKQGDTIGKTS